MTPLNHTPNGRLAFCKCCDCYQLEFGNILTTFSKKDYIIFKNHINNIDAEICIQKNKHFSSKRKIFVAFTDKFYFSLTPDELEELKILLQLKKYSYNSCSCQKQLIIKENINPN